MRSSSVSTRDRMVTMKAPVLVPVEEYLSTSYRPDCDYVDGEVLERNVGEHDHSDLQSELVYYFRARRKQWRLHAVVEQRVQVAPTRFRIPDVCVMKGGGPYPPIFHEPPFICIEVLSKKDRQTRVQDRIDDYLRFGVPYVWVINPANRRVWTHTADGITEVKDSVLRTENPSIEVLLGEVFAGLDDAGA
jgi:Uma2 family endonuclease